jgi:hypothetical protein
MWTIANLNRDNLVPDNLESVCLEINQPNSRSFLYRFYYLSSAVMQQPLSHVLSKCRLEWFLSTCLYKRYFYATTDAISGSKSEDSFVLTAQDENNRNPAGKTTSIQHRINVGNDHPDVG